MSDFRYDPIQAQWVCIAEYRSERPFEFRQQSERRPGLDCPFCLGNESQTPDAIAQYGFEAGVLNQISTGDWTVRVVPNKFPALVDKTPAVPALAGSDYRVAHGGSQEVILISPRHVRSLSDLRDEELFSAFEVFQYRVAAYRSRQNVRHTCLFMNCLAQAGASIEHAHFQLIGSPICTGQVQQQFRRMSQPSDGGHSCWQRLLDWEIQQQIRVMDHASDFLVFCPFASRYARQIRIAPLNLTRRFDDLEPASCRNLASLCRKWVARLEQIVESLAYNVVFHLPPHDLSSKFWFVDLIPRIPQSAGFEIATECWINPFSPESTAAKLRQD